ncbi:MAG: RluA family pseudouridine synthase [Planctomycetota bacterium]|nr:RluA family pseudouridine synthase [Planctomycetota bacterium]
MPPPLPILHLDDALILLDKPSGLLSVPGKGAENADNLATRVQAQFADALVVHRLDRDTSGLLLMARGLESQRHLSAQFERREVTKCYIAEVFGSVQKQTGSQSGTIDLPLVKDFENPPRHKVDHIHGRVAVTHWRVLSSTENGDRLELIPETGRSHQLRVHLSHIGHPILGDNLYAPEAVRSLAPRLCLHAHELQFVHPVTGELVHFMSPVPF